jgi:uncharacterized protein (DUF427 family)
MFAWNSWKRRAVGKLPILGKANLLTVRVGSRSENAAWLIAEPSLEAVEIEGYIAFKWGEMDAWFEEEEQFTSPRSYTRIDVIQSHRNVRIELNGEIIAETDRPVCCSRPACRHSLLYPKGGRKIDLFEASDTHTACPYKGVASLFAKLGDRTIRTLVWYPAPPIGRKNTRPGRFLPGEGRRDLRGRIKQV